MAKGEALDQTKHRSSRVDRMDSRSTGSIKRTWRKWRVITAVISSRGMHLDRRIAIQRRREDAFYNAH